jgi:sulfoxide reductase heme-binding subunit YedZ
MVLSRVLAARRTLKSILHLAAALPLGLLVARAIWLPASLGANPVAMLTDSLGLWALRLLLLTLALTPLRILTGVSHWLLYRRLVGLWAALYATLHFSLYVLVDQRLEWQVLLEDVLKRPWITVGASALMIFWILSLTSFTALRRRLGRHWDALHRLVYAAAILGVWHYYWQVKKDVRAPLCYAAILATLFAARLLRRQIKARFSPATVLGKT